MCRPFTAASVMVRISPSRLVSSAHGAVERTSGRDLADHLELHRNIGGVGCAHRIAVHRRHRLRRLGALRGDVARQRAVKGGIERDGFLAQRLAAREDRG